MSSIAGVGDGPKTGRQLYFTPVEVKFGEQLEAADLEHLRYYMMLSIADVAQFDDSETTRADVPVLQAMLLDILDAINNIENNVADFSKTGDEFDAPEGMFAALGYSIRQHYEGTTLMEEISITSSLGIFGTIRDSLYHPFLWWLKGANLQDLFGEWSRLRFRPIDDMFVGVFAMARYIAFLMTLFYYSFGDTLRRAVIYNDDGSAVYTRFNPDIKETWDSILFDKGWYGLDESYVNDPDVRGFPVYVLDGFEQVVSRILGRKSWNWRFGRDIEVIPMFSLGYPGSSRPDCMPVTLYDSNDANEQIWRFGGANSNTNDNNVMGIHRLYNSMISQLQSLWIDNKVLAPMKNWWNQKFLIDLEIKPSNAGLIWFQMMEYHAEAVATDLHMVTSSTLQADKGSNLDDYLGTLMQRKEFDNNITNEYRIEVIGDDVDIEHFRELFSLVALYDDTDAAAHQILDIVHLNPVGIMKNEARERLDPDGDAIVTDGELSDDMIYSVLPWRRSANNAGEGNDNFNTPSYHDDLIVGDYLNDRPVDPFKKVKHVWYDVKYFDVDEIRKSLCNLFFSVAPKQEASAPPAAEPKITDIIGKDDEHEEDWEEKKGQKSSAPPEDKKDEKKDKDEQEASAPPDESKKEANKKKAAEALEKKKEKKKKIADDKKAAQEKKKKNKEANSK